MSDNWETDIASLLTDLSGVQGEILDLLTQKRQILASGDRDALAATNERESQLSARLTSCHQRRQQLLDRAAAEGLPSDSIRTLSTSLPEAGRDPLAAPSADAV